MAPNDDKIDLLSVAVTDLRKSLEKLCQGSTFPPYNYGFPEHFVQQRDLHFSHFYITRIDGLKFFRESEYSGKSCPRFEQKEVTNFATSIQRQLTSLDARIDNLAFDHNQLVSNVSVLSDGVDKVTTGAGGSLHTTITNSTGAAFSGMAGNDNAPLRTPGDYAPPPVRHLLHSTIVSAQGRVRYTSETVPPHKLPIFFTGRFG